MGGRLHPSVAAVRRAIRESCSDVEPGSAVVVACSGGVDSLALAHGLAFEGPRAGWLMSAVVIDHQLQADSAAVAARVAEQLEGLGYEQVSVIRVEVASDGGPEAAARTARYRALEQAADEIDSVVLLGHTLDDQAETVVLGLGRGSGTRSLAGMPPVRGRFRRPLLGLTRALTAEACAASGLDPWTDPQNSDRRFRRVGVRLDVLPTLEQSLGPGIPEALARTARLARDDADALDSWADDALAVANTTTGGLDVGAVSGLPPAVRRRVVRTAAIAAGCPAGDLSALHVEAVDALVTAWHGQGAIDLPGRVCARRLGTEIRFERAVGG